MSTYAAPYSRPYYLQVGIAIHQTLETLNMMNEPNRRRLPEMRPAMTVKKTIDDHEMYITVGFYDDAPERCQPAEVFLTISKNQATAVNAALQAWMVAMSLALQSGVPWVKMLEKFRDGDHLTKGIANAIESCVTQRQSDVGYYDEPDQDTLGEIPITTPTVLHEASTPPPGDPPIPADWHMDNPGDPGGGGNSASV